MAEAFGRFWLQQKIGQGGMAEIFRATVGPDPSSYAFEFVVKRLHEHLQQDEAQRGMFLTEADLASHLRHPNLVEVYESGLVDGRAYIAMERIWGVDLSRLLSVMRRRSQRFPAELAVYVVLQVLRALDYIHRAKAPGGRDLELIHRDVTPSNIFIGYRGEVKLGDLGVARVGFLEGYDDANVLKGKVAYTPPEVLVGHEISQRDDLWALSLTLYEMLAGRSPYSGIDEADLLAGTVQPKITPIRKAQPEVDARLSALLMRALHPKPRKRPGEAVALYRELKAYLVDGSAQVDARALAQFVGSVVGDEGGEKGPEATDGGGFEAPSYQVPIEFTPTQRIAMRAETRSHRRPLLIGAAALVLVLAGLGIGRLLRGPATPASPSQPASPPVATELKEPEAPPVAPPVLEPSAPAPVETPAPPSNLPKTYDALMREAQKLSKRRKYSDAIVRFEAARKLRPDSSAALLGQASLLVEVNDLPAAERLLLDAKRGEARNPRYFIVLGKLLREQGKIEAARQAYRHAIELEPGGRTADVARKALADLDKG